MHTNRLPARLWIMAACAALTCLGTVAHTSPADAPSPASLPPLSQRLGFWSPTEQEKGYRAMETVFPAHVIAAPPAARPLPVADKPLSVSFTFHNRPYTTDDFMKIARVSGLLVIKDGQVLVERYGLGRQPQDRWTSFSIAKSLTSTLLGAAIREGKIKSIDDPVSRYIPELQEGAYQGVTLRQMLTMTSGVAWDEDYDNPRSDFNLHATETGPAFYRLMAHKQRLHAPGTFYHYSTGESNLLGAVVLNATGKSLADYASETIWKPAGMERDGVWITSPDHLETGGICFSATLRDYGRLGLFMLNGAMADGKPVLPDGWIEAATRKQVESDYDSGYGYQWWVPRPGAYRAIGIMGQMVHIDTGRHLVIVVNSAWTTSGSKSEYDLLVAYMDAVEKGVDRR